MTFIIQKYCVVFYRIPYVTILFSRSNTMDEFGGIFLADLVKRNLLCIDRDLIASVFSSTSFDNSPFILVNTTDNVLFVVGLTISLISVCDPNPMKQVTLKNSIVST
eukprot:732330_1